MSERAEKLLLALEASRGNADRLYQQAVMLGEILRQIDAGHTGKGPGNYQVLSPHYQGYAWWPVVAGTRDYCQGYAEALSGGVIVVCGQFICWPEERWSELVEGAIA